MLSNMTYSTHETQQIGRILGRLLKKGDVISVDGDLGVGKTIFAKGVAKGLQITERVNSPTFALIKEYSGRLPLYHMDFYRLGSAEELEDLGYEEYFYGLGVTLIEWAERVKQYLPAQRLDILIEKSTDDENIRLIYFKPHGIRYNSLIEELKQRVRSGN